MKQNKNLNSSSVMKRIKTILVVALLGIGTLGAWAQSGDFGVNNALHWELVNGTLTINGTGMMPDYYSLDNPWSNYKSQITQVVIEDGVMTIGVNAFAECSNLTSVTIPNNVTRIGLGAFGYCSSLTSINTPYNSMNNIPYSVTSIEDYTFYNCTSLGSINMSFSGVRSIGNYAFSGCTNLYGILLPYGTTRIGDHAFEGCRNLTYTNLPNSVTSIGDFAFGGCNLTSVTIPASVTSIGIYSFIACLRLTAIEVESANLSYSSEDGVLFNKDKTTLICYPAGKSDSNYTLPGSVTSIEGYAFYSCSFTSITNLNVTPQSINANVFANVNISADTLYVPLGSKAAYKAAPVWKDFGNIVEIGAITPYYTAVTQPYPSSMTFTASVLLNGAELQSDQLEIGAFCGNECRGSVLLQNYPEATTHPYLGFLVVHGNDNDNITFKVYDHETGKEYIATNAPVIFTADNIYGNPAAPYSIMITEVVTQTIPLVAGWSWISTNVVNDNPSLMSQFKQNIGAAGVLLKGQNEFIQTPGWIGTLSAINNTAMYMVNTTAETNLPFTGLPVDPAATPVALLNGWNWIGYTPQASLPLNDALAKLNPQNGDQIKSRTDYSQYTTGQGWAGGLSTMNPGEGYKYYSANTATQSLVYPAAAAVQLRSSNSENALDLKWTTNANRFANNMTLTFVVSQDNRELQSDNIEIGAFCGDDCRGTAMLKNLPQITGHPYMGFLVIFGNDNDNIRLRVYNHETGQEYEVDNISLSFESDAILGNPTEPLQIMASPTGIPGLQSGSVYVYMNSAGDKLNIHRPWNIIDRLEITDLNGRTVWQATGFASESINVSSLAKGVYLLKLIKDNQSSVYKFIKK